MIRVAVVSPRRGEDGNGRTIRNCNGCIERYWSFTGKRTRDTGLRSGNLLIRQRLQAAARIAWTRHSGDRYSSGLSYARGRGTILGSSGVDGTKHRCRLPQCRRWCRWPFCRNRFGCRTEHGGPELRGYGAAGEVRGSTYALAQ